MLEFDGDDANPIAQFLKLHAPERLRQNVRELIISRDLLENNLPALLTLSLI